MAQFHEEFAKAELWMIAAALGIIVLTPSEVAWIKEVIDH
jgi:hypothetical protein